MQYNLSEDQSIKFYKDLEEAIETIDELHEKAIAVYKNWYDLYVKNHHSWFGFKPASFEKFGKMISLSKGIIIDKNNDKDILTTIDGWGSNLRGNYISKLIHKDYIYTLGEINVVSAACAASAYKHTEYNTWFEMYDKMKNYMNVPYIIDDEWLSVMETLPTDVNLYKRVLENVK